MVIRGVRLKSSAKALYLTVTSKVDLKSSLLPIQRVLVIEILICSRSLGPAGPGSMGESAGGGAMAMPKCEDRGTMKEAV